MLLNQVMLWVESQRRIEIMHILKETSRISSSPVYDRIVYRKVLIDSVPTSLIVFMLYIYSILELRKPKYILCCDSVIFVYYTYLLLSLLRCWLPCALRDQNQICLGIILGLLCRLVCRGYSIVNLYKLKFSNLYIPNF